MVEELSKIAPYRVKINATPCILVTKNDSISISFERLKKSFEIPHDTVRCIQHRGNSILLNAEKNTELVVYVVTTSNAKKIYKKIISQME